MSDNSASEKVGLYPGMRPGEKLFLARISSFAIHHLLDLTEDSDFQCLVQEGFAPQIIAPYPIIRQAIEDEDAMTYYVLLDGIEGENLFDYVNNQKLDTEEVTTLAKGFFDLLKAMSKYDLMQIDYHARNFFRNSVNRKVMAVDYPQLIPYSSSKSEAEELRRECSYVGQFGDVLMEAFLGIDPEAINEALRGEDSFAK